MSVQERERSRRAADPLPRQGSRGVDFDLHGIVGIRLLDATERDVRTVVRQIGPLQGSLHRDPDITVRFVDRLDDPGPLTYVGWRSAGFNDKGFFVVGGAGPSSGRARIPFHDVGGHCDNVCERSLPAVPLLLAILNFTALAHGVLPLHASAVDYHGSGVLATGWAKGGKTETLLALMTAGATHIGDEWVYVTADRRLFGVPEPMRLWRWQLEQLPDVRARLTGRERAGMAGWHLASRALSGLTHGVPGTGTRTSLGSALQRLGAGLDRRVSVQVPPVRLFGSPRVSLRGRLDHVLFVASHTSPDIRLEPVEGDEVALRMQASLADERSVFMSWYRQFRFAFPRLASPVVETAPEREAALLAATFVNTPAWWLGHPYPVSIAALRQEVLGLIEPAPRTPPP
jgi:hypothetical protein